MHSATLSGHLLSQRPHPDVQACVFIEPVFLFFPTRKHVPFYENWVQTTKEWMEDDLTAVMFLNVCGAHLSICEAVWEVLDTTV